MKIKFLIKIMWPWLVCVFLVSASAAQPVWATSGEDEEKPQPEFTRQGKKITAKLLPRAKSTSVLIDFEVSGAELVDVRGMDFEKADRPEVDHKDFKSALFIIEMLTDSSGAEAKVSVSSDFFIRSTQFWIFNQNLKTPWVNSKAQNLDRPERVQELVINVKDGGPFDSDTKADGRITLTGGPKDSFWGYALGTLFIRYFGIFIVLSILMFGMIFSGKIFQHLEEKRIRAKSKPLSLTVQAEKAEKPEPADQGMTAEMAAAVAAALHLHFSGMRASHPQPVSPMRPTAWAQQGRSQIIGERLMMYHRNKHKL